MILLTATYLHLSYVVLPLNCETCLIIFVVIPDIVDLSNVFLSVLVLLECNKFIILLIYCKCEHYF